MFNAKGEVNDESVTTSSPTAAAAAAPTTGVEPAEILVISDLAVLRVLSDGLRLQLIEAFGRSRGVPRSVKEVAKEIGQSPTKLYYHVNLLEENGLLLVAESRLVSGILEKKYVPAARRYTIDDELLKTAHAGGSAESHAAVDHAIETVLRSTADDFKRAMAAGTAAIGDDAEPRNRSVLSKANLRLRPADAVKVFELLESLQKTDDNSAPDADVYGLTLAFYRKPGAEDSNDDGR